jgi:hypothetical protein
LILWRIGRRGWIGLVEFHDSISNIYQADEPRFIFGACGRVPLSAPWYQAALRIFARN